MGTLTSLIEMSREAIMADQTALNVTANNVSNQNTPGYTREVVNWQPVDAVTINGSTYYVADNNGPSAISQRDRVLEQRVQQQTQVQSQSSALESAMQEIQNVFGLSSTSESASSTAIGLSFTRCWAASTQSCAVGMPSGASAMRPIRSRPGSAASSSANGRAGGIALFLGVVRDNDAGQDGVDRGVTGLGYSAHPSAEAELRRVAEEVIAKHDGVIALAAVRSPTIAASMC